MSANEVIEQIAQLPPQEQEKVFAYLNSKLRRSDDGVSRDVSPEFKRVAEKVFERNAELFRRLAKARTT